MAVPESSPLTGPNSSSDESSSMIEQQLSTLSIDVPLASSTSSQNMDPNVHRTESDPSKPISASIPAPKKKKEKPPKPGSKKAQMASKKAREEKNSSPMKQSTRLPQIILYGRVLIFLFENAESLKMAFGRPHVSYEGHELKGPLKGINFPISHYHNWCQTITGTSDKNQPESSDTMTEYEVQMKYQIDEFLNNHSASVDVEATENEAEAPSSHSSQIQSQTPVYLIASLEKDASTFTHEWAHAIYHIVPSYRHIVESAWTNLPPALRSGIEKELIMRNYHRDMFPDEFQAYLVESPFEFGKRWSQELVPYHREFKQLVDPPIFSKLLAESKMKQ